MEYESKSAIVFFSKDGNTRIGAKLLNSRVNGKIIELKEAKRGNFIQAIFKKGSRLMGNPWLEIIDIKQVYLMLPIWASNGAPAMNAFLKRADLSGKEVCIITFQQFADFRNSENVHKHITDIVEEKNGLVKARYALLGGKMGHCADENTIKKQIDMIEILS